MNHKLQTPFLAALLIATLVVVGILVGTTIYHRYTGLTRGQSALLWLLAIGLAVVTVGFPAISPINQHFSGNPDEKPFLKLSGFILLWLLVLPFGVKLYRKWIGGHLTEVEKLPGIDGVRAWLGVGNVICAALIPICVWAVSGFSPIGFWALMFGLLLAYPLLNMASESAQPVPVAPTEDLSGEREKVLQLLETGKISAVESAELLNALGHSAPPSPKPATEINPQRKMVLLGAALLLIGFFLPWFTINPGHMVNEATAQMQQMMGGMMPNNNAAQMIGSEFGVTVQVHAGDLTHGLGWWILAMGIVAAVLPFFATTLEASMQKKIILAALGIGAILLIYLFSDNFRYVSFGILLVLAGYVLELVGTLKERPSPR
jgi:hypothetical protein